jgi:indole-3-glycerol phosphate synthase
MKNVLRDIISSKKKEVTHLKNLFPKEMLMQGKLFGRNCISLKKKLSEEGASGIIAEFKQKSPSKGVINCAVKVDEVTRDYVRAGASGLSVLTDFDFFGGTVINLVKARIANPYSPVLRKDFVVDPYQIFEAKAYGADVILLIAACLSKEEVHLLARQAKELGLEVLIELHEEEELEKISPLVDLVGVNNRNLKTLQVNVETSLHLARLIPDKFARISESGLTSPEIIKTLRDAGYAGFLIGEAFMKHKNPGKACAGFIGALKSKING